MKGGVFASIDVGTTKVCTVVGEVLPEQPLRILGVGVAAADGLSRGMVENLRDASESIRVSVEKAERASGTRILSAHVGVSGPHISCLNNRGIVAIPEREQAISDDDMTRVLDGARIVSIPTNREIIHIVPRYYIVWADGPQHQRLLQNYHTARKYEIQSVPSFILGERVLTGVVGEDVMRDAAEEIVGFSFS